jgi:hypothetical protein
MGQALIWYIRRPRNIMAGSTRIEHTNDGIEVTFENGRKYEVTEDAEGGVVCRLIEGTLLLYPYSSTASGVLEDGALDEINKSAELYEKKKRF